MQNVPGVYHQNLVPPYIFLGMAASGEQWDMVLNLPPTIKYNTLSNDTFLVRSLQKRYIFWIFCLLKEPLSETFMWFLNALALQRRILETHSTSDAMVDS